MVFDIAGYGTCLSFSCKCVTAYAPSDANAERALAVDRGFDAAARAHTIDISADDDSGLYKQEKSKKWFFFLFF